MDLDFSTDGLAPKRMFQHGLTGTVSLLHFLMLSERSPGHTFPSTLSTSLCIKLKQDNHPSSAKSSRGAIMLLDGPAVVAQDSITTN